MDNLIQLKELQIPVLNKLLMDKTTGKNIIWATDSYSDRGKGYQRDQQMLFEQVIKSGFLQPRILKSLDVQKERTKKNAEVYTPAWICNLMNNQIDQDWFDDKKGFNQQEDKNWIVNADHISFLNQDKKTWKEYVNRKVLEITCGEAPFLVSRYDSSTGNPIDIQDRMGLFDRKLRVVTENTNNFEDWYKWALKALKSTYGYEFQGDSLLIGRVNVYLTLLENAKEIWNQDLTVKQQEQIADIICWNLFQMDGLTDCIPVGAPADQFVQASLFDFFEIEKTNDETTSPPVIINWWDNKSKMTIREMKEGIGMGKRKFSVVIGNPPYQQETTDKSSNNGQKSRKNIFHYFQIAADHLSEQSSVMIYPGARWIHRSGKGLSTFGLEQINDPHLNKLIFYPEAKDIFGQSADLADGISIVIKNFKKIKPGFRYEYRSSDFVEEIEMENPGEELLPLDPRNLMILKKIAEKSEKLSLVPLHDSIFPRTLFGIESDYVSKNKDKVRIYDETEGYDPLTEIKVLTNDKAGKAGRAKWFVLNKKLLPKGHEYIDQWKVIVSSANAGGQKRDNQLEIVGPGAAFGRARVALKIFSSEEEARNFYQYVRSDLIKYLFLMTDEALSTLALKVPDMKDYKNSSELIDFSKSLDNQLFSLFELDSSEQLYIQDYVLNYRSNSKEKN